MVLKVPVFWVWILGIFVVVATLFLSYFGWWEAEQGPRYKVGTCLRNESLGLVTQVVGAEGGLYRLRILSSRKYPHHDSYQVDQIRERGIPEVEQGSDERPIPCPRPSKD